MTFRTTLQGTLFSDASVLFSLVVSATAVDAVAASASVATAVDAVATSVATAINAIVAYVATVVYDVAASVATAVDAVVVSVATVVDAVAITTLDCCYFLFLFCVIIAVVVLVAIVVALLVFLILCNFEFFLFLLRRSESICAFTKRVQSERLYLNGSHMRRTAQAQKGVVSE